MVCELEENMYLTRVVLIKIWRLVFLSENEDFGFEVNFLQMCLDNRHNEAVVCVKQRFKNKSRILQSNPLCLW